MLDEKAELLKLRILNNKLKSHEFNENEKINEIKKNNQLLLDRLLDISKGKWASPGMKHKQPKKRMGPKSLNHVTKKRELERIDNENMKLMHRIVNQNPMLNTKKLEKEYRERRKLQKSLQRNRIIPIKSILKKKHERSAHRLPALQNINTPSAKDSNENKYSQSVSGSKKEPRSDLRASKEGAKEEKPESQTIQNKTPKQNKEVAKKPTKSTPGRVGGYVSVM